MDVLASALLPPTAGPPPATQTAAEQFAQLGPDTLAQVNKILKEAGYDALP